MKQCFIILLLILNIPSYAEQFDPFEETNRSIYRFNTQINAIMLDPISQSYKNNTPIFIQNCISNFFNNLGDISTMTNQLLQFKIDKSLTTLGRVLINTTAGIVGLFDVASIIPLTTNNEDFGQTLATWGVTEGPYLMLPLLGPSTLRDTAGLYIDITNNTNINQHLKSKEAVAMTAVKTINTRAKLLTFTNLLKQSDDPYITLRSSFLQKRKYDIFDGNPSTNTVTYEGI